LKDLNKFSITQLVYNCRNPTLKEVWSCHSHSRNGDLGVLRDSRKLRTRLQLSKHLTLRCSLYCRKGPEVWMSKIPSHGPFTHLQHKLCANERSGVKVAVWLPTTKSRELTRPRCAQAKCDTPLESSWGELQVWLRPHPDRRFEQRVMSCQSPGSLNRVSLGIVSGQFWDFHLKVSRQKTIWMWPPWSGAEYTIWGKVVASPEFGPWP
jgi:hypothetical protein